MANFLTRQRRPPLLPRARASTGRRSSSSPSSADARTTPSATPTEALAFYREVAEMVGELAADDVAPHAAEIDRAGRALRGRRGGVPAAPRRRSSTRSATSSCTGCACRATSAGSTRRSLLYFINTELLARADVSVMAHHGFHGGMATAMLMFSILEGTTTFDAADGRASLTTRFARGDRRDRPRRGLGLHGHHRARRGERHGRPAHRR